VFNPLAVITSRANLRFRGRGLWWRGLIVTLGLGTSLGLAGCQTPTPSPLPTKIVVSIIPQAYFVNKIMGSQGQVTVMVEPGADPHSYEPSPQQLQALGQAQAYVKVGLGFEKGWLDKFKSVNPNLSFIDSAQGITPLPEVAHGHDHDHHHSQGQTLDPHIWLSPPLVKRQAENIYRGLAQINPAQASTYEANLKKFGAEIDQLDGQIRQKLAPFKNSKFIVFHPAWGYFAQTYHLNQIPIEVQGQEPSAQELAQVIKIARAENIGIIFAQPQFSAKSAQAIAAEIKGKVIFIDDLAPHWADNLGSVAQILAQTLNTNGR